MYYILYNPLSNGGTCIEKANKLAKKLNKENKENKCISLLDINDIQSFLDSVYKEDIIIIVGGDGTLYHMANKLNNYDIKDKTVYLAKAGTGNDFYRDLKKTEVDGLVKIDQFITKTPSAISENKTHHFNNSCGIGVDGDICDRVNKSQKKSSINYLLTCIKAVFNFKRYILNINIDGKSHIFEKTWFTAVMNGKYFGGGMKVAPKQDRTTDEFTVVVVQKVPALLLVFILPTIYIGKHTIFKRYVKTLKGKNIEITTDIPQLCELDGDILGNISKLKVSKK